MPAPKDGVARLEVASGRTHQVGISWRDGVTDARETNLVAGTGWSGPGYVGAPGAGQILAHRDRTTNPGACCVFETGRWMASAEAITGLLGRRFPTVFDTTAAPVKRQHLDQRHLGWTLTGVCKLGRHGFTARYDRLDFNAGNDWYTATDPYTMNGATGLRTGIDATPRYSEAILGYTCLFDPARPRNGKLEVDLLHRSRNFLLSGPGQSGMQGGDSLVVSLEAGFQAPDGSGAGPPGGPRAGQDSLPAQGRGPGTIEGSPSGAVQPEPSSAGTMTDTHPQARVIKALTQDGHIRLSSLDASPLWDGVRRGHPHLESQACACLTELLAASALLQSRTLFTERLQLLLKGGGRAKALVADCWPDGTVRGVLDVREESGDGAWILGPGLLQVMRSNPSGQPYIGTLPLVEGGIQTQIEHYLQQSEQVQASVTLWCDPATGEAGGLLVEPLPQCPPERLARLVQAIDGLDVVPLWERTPDFLATWVAQGQGTEELSATGLVYRCRCSREALLATLRTFPREQKEDLFREPGEVEVRCDYCGTRYPIHREDLLGGEA